MNVAFVLHPQLAADTHPVADWALSSVLLMNDSRYPWLILVPRLAGMRDLIDLDPGDWHKLDDEIDRASRALKAATAAHKLNVAALGNMVEQLHVHIIARRTTDAAWPGPVWGAHPPLHYDDAARDALLDRLRAQFDESP